VHNLFLESQLFQHDKFIEFCLRRDTRKSYSAVKIRCKNVLRRLSRMLKVGFMGKCKNAKLVFIQHIYIRQDTLIEGGRHHHHRYRWPRSGLLALSEIAVRTIDRRSLAAPCKKGLESLRASVDARYTFYSTHIPSACKTHQFIGTATCFDS
jgi:hypothetical protein